MKLANIKQESCVPPRHSAQSVTCLSVISFQELSCLLVSLCNYTRQYVRGKKGYIKTASLFYSLFPRSFQGRGPIIGFTWCLTELLQVSSVLYSFHYCSRRPEGDGFKHFFQTLSEIKISSSQVYLFQLL